MNEVWDKMKKSFMKWIVFMLIFVISLSSLLYGKKNLVYASSATVYFEVNKEEVITGEEVTVYMTIETEVSLGDYEGYVLYDPQYLEFISGPPCFTGGDGVLRISDLGAQESQSKRKYAIKFKPIQVGVTNIMIQGGSIAYEFETGDPMSISSSSYMLNIVPPYEASNDATLAVLKISPGKLLPNFQPDVFEYNTTIDSSENNLIVSAIANDKNAEVLVSGNENLDEGENEVIITVIAESGQKQTYGIQVQKEAMEEDTTQNEEEIVNEPFDHTFRFGARNEDGVTYIDGQYFYKVTKKQDLITIPEGYTKIPLLIDGITIEAYGTENNSDFYLLALENEAGDVNLYRYDRIEKTIQRVVQQNSSNNSEEQANRLVTELATSTREYEENVSRLGLIIAGLCALVLVLSVIIVSLFKKIRGFDDDY